MKESLLGSVVIFFIVMSFSCSKELTMNQVYLQEEISEKSEVLAQRIKDTDESRTYTKDNVYEGKAFNKQGYALYKKKQDKRAIQKYLKALQNYPLAKTYYNLGNSLMNVKKYAKAEIAYLVALKYRPNNHLYNYNLACAYSLKNNTEKSLIYLEKALKLGYNSFAHINHDPDMINTRATTKYDILLQQYQSKKLTESHILRERYCVKNEGYADETFHFSKDGLVTFSRSGPEHETYPPSYYDVEVVYAAEGSWYINNGKVHVNIPGRINTNLYVSLGTHICSY